MSSRWCTAVAISWFHTSRHGSLSSNTSRLSNVYCANYTLMQATIELVFVLRFVCFESVRRSKAICLTRNLHAGCIQERGRYFPSAVKRLYISLARSKQSSLISDIYSHILNAFHPSTSSTPLYIHTTRTYFTMPANAVTTMYFTMPTTTAATGHLSPEVRWKIASRPGRHSHSLMFLNSCCIPFPDLTATASTQLDLQYINPWVFCIAKKSRTRSFLHHHDVSTSKDGPAEPFL
jgi:hypothetical protein